MACVRLACLCADLARVVRLPSARYRRPGLRSPLSSIAHQFRTTAAARPRRGASRSTMARYTGPVCRLCRRQGMKLFLKGDRCFTPKCAVERRPYPPGPQPTRRRKVSEYSLQLREKQKARHVYGVLERQFRRHFAEAERRQGQTGENLLRILECRLDNVIYRLGFADSRAQARQLVTHGHFDLNGRKTDIDSALQEQLIVEFYSR